MEIIDNKYRLEIKIGEGGFSEVYLGTCLKTNEKVAIKKVSLLQKSLKDERTFNKLKMEIELLQKLDHPNIVKYYDVVKTNSHWYIVMEYCNAGTLDDVIEFNNTMSKKAIHFNREANTYYYLDQLKDAMNYIRRLAYIHRDIKPKNVLLTKYLANSIVSLDDSGTIFKSDEQIDKLNVDPNKPIDYNYSEKLVLKLADFGLAKHYMDNEDSLMNTICGSPLYMAPELILNKEYNSKADLWSYGIIMYQLLFGNHPISATTFPQLYQNLKSKSIDFHMNKNFTPNCFDLLTKLLVKDHRMRMDWGNFFNHKWFSYWKNNNGDLSLVVRKPSSDLPKVGDALLRSNDSFNNDSLYDSAVRSTPIKIGKSNAVSCRQGKLSDECPKFTPPIGSANNSPVSMSPSMSPLGFSNLSKMKIDNYYAKPLAQGKYCDYPSSYPPNDPRRSLSRFPSTPMSSSPLQNPLAQFSKSYGSSMDKQLSTSRSRIFKNFNSDLSLDKSTHDRRSDSKGTMTSPTSEKSDNTVPASNNKFDMSDFVLPNYRDDAAPPKSEPIAINKNIEQTESALSYIQSPITYVKQ